MADRFRRWVKHLALFAMTTVVLCAGLPVGGGAETRTRSDAEAARVDGMLRETDGSWRLVHREGRMWLPMGDGVAWRVIQPVDGPVLVVPEGVRQRVDIATSTSITYRLEWAQKGAAPDMVEVRWYADPKSTRKPVVWRVERVTASGFQQMAVNETLPVVVRGSGHRVGMSQYGAYGLAVRGVGYAAILQHYYPGTRLEKRATGDGQTWVTVRLNDGTRKSEWALRVPTSAGSVTVKSGTQTLTQLAAGEYAIKVQNGRLGIWRKGTSGSALASVPLLASGDATLTLIPQQGPLEVIRSGSTYTAYAGQLEAWGNASGVQLRNRVTLDKYLEGVVPHEMPASWHVEALKAQTVAARTYVVRRNLFVGDSTSDQVYNGVYSNATYAQKIRQVVAETDGRILTYGGQLIEALYSSTNGGWTETNRQAWGSPPLPYLPGRRDVFRLANGQAIVPEEQVKAPYYVRVIEISRSAIESRYKQIGTLQAIETIKRAPGMGVVSFVLKGTKGTVEVDGHAFRKAFGLPSDLYFADRLVTTTSLEGATRYDTAVAISQSGWPNSAPAVVLARGDIAADALVSGVLAHKVQGPLLLSKPNELPAAVANELKRLKPSKVILVGGRGALSPQVETKVRNLLGPSVTVQRIEGATRYATAVRVAEVFGTGVREAVIATGLNDSPDALTVAPYAARRGMPILLEDSDQKLRPEIVNYLRNRSIERVYLIGGTGVLPEALKTQLNQLGVREVERISGPDRYATAVQVAERWFPASQAFAVARGDLFPDALSGSAWAARQGVPILLTQPHRIPEVLTGWLQKRGTSLPEVVYFGGPGAISPAVRQQMETLLVENLYAASQ